MQFFMLDIWFLLLLTHIIWNFYPSLFFKCQVCCKYTAWIDMDWGSRLFSNITEWRKTTISICSLKIDLQHVFGITEDGRCSSDSAFRATVHEFPLQRDSLACLKMASGIQTPFIIEDTQVRQGKESISFSE